MDWLPDVLRRLRREVRKFVGVWTVFMFALAVIFVPPTSPGQAIGFALIALASGIAIAPLVWVRWTYGPTGEGDIRGLRLLGLIALSIAWGVFVGVLAGAAFWIGGRV